MTDTPGSAETEIDRLARGELIVPSSFPPDPSHGSPDLPSADVEGFRSWAAAALRDAEARYLQLDTGWWRHVAIKLAEKGGRILEDNERLRADREQQVRLKEMSMRDIAEAESALSQANQRAETLERLLTEAEYVIGHAEIGKHAPELLRSIRRALDTPSTPKVVNSMFGTWCDNCGANLNDDYCHCPGLAPNPHSSWRPAQPPSTPEETQ